MSLAAHRFGHVKFLISNICCCLLRQVRAVKKIKTNVQNLKRPNQWAVENISNVKWNYFHIFSLAISVDLECGGKSMENSTYLTLSSKNTFNSDDQTCIYTICSMSTKICRIRFDFTVSCIFLNFILFFQFECAI